MAEGDVQVQLKIFDAIVGLATIDGDGETISIRVTAPGTHEYLKQLILEEDADYLTLTPEAYTTFIDFTPEDPAKRRLRLVKDTDTH